MAVVVCTITDTRGLLLPSVGSSELDHASDQLNNPVNFVDPDGQVLVLVVPFVGIGGFDLLAAGGGAAIAALLLTSGDSQSSDVPSSFERVSIQNQKDTGLQDLTDAEIAELLNEKTISKEQKMAFVEGTEGT